MWTVFVLAGYVTQYYPHRHQLGHPKIVILRLTKEIIVKYFVSCLKQNLGTVINLSDAMIIRGMKDYSIYSVAKGGLETLTKSLAKELAPEIRVNAVAPGAILLPSDGSSDEETLVSNIPLGRIGKEEDISSAVFYLSQNKYITGQILRVDGGRSLN